MMSGADARADVPEEPSTRVAAIVLAAGASRRLGQAKQLVPFAGETLLRGAVRTASAAGCAPVVVVLGAGALEIEAAWTHARQASGELQAAAGANPHVRLLVNPDWAEGMASSIRAGVQSLRAESDARRRGTLILTCDQPMITPAHLRDLARDQDETTASAYGGRHGVPAYFPLHAEPALLALRGDMGARELLRGARAVSFEAAAIDVDTPEALHALRSMFRPDPFG